MAHENYIHSTLIATKDELAKALKDLRFQEASLKRQIRDIKNSTGTSFNPLNYYEESLSNVRRLITNVRFYIKKQKQI